MWLATKHIARQAFPGTHLIVEVANVAHNGVVLHLGHVVRHDDVLVAGGGDEDVGGLQHILQGCHLRQGWGGPCSGGCAQSIGQPRP